MSDSGTPGRRRKRRKRKGKRPIGRAREIVKEISDILKQDSFQESVGIKASEIFVGGSLGQGTIVYAHYDIDLVLYSTSLLPREREVVKTGYDDILTKLDEYLEEEMEDYTFLSMSEVAVKFQVRDYEIDLLLSPLWASPDELYSYLRTVKPPIKRLMFSASVSKLQVKLMRRQPNRVKVLVGRFKAWRNDLDVWKQSSDGRPKSYFMTLLVIAAYNSAPEGIVSGRKIKRLAIWVTKELQRMVKMIQSDKELDLSIPGADEETMEKYSDLLPPKPRITDPVNPSNNVFLSGVGPIKQGQYTNKWDIFAREIDSLDLNAKKEKLYLLPQSFVF